MVLDLPVEPSEVDSDPKVGFGLGPNVELSKVDPNPKLTKLRLWFRSPYVEGKRASDDA